MTMFDTLEYSENAQQAEFVKEQADFDLKNYQNGLIVNWLLKLIWKK